MAPPLSSPKKASGNTGPGETPRNPSSERVFQALGEACIPGPSQSRNLGPSLTHGIIRERERERVPPWGEGGETGSSGLKGEACPGVPWQRSPAAHTAGLRQGEARLPLSPRRLPGERHAPHLGGGGPPEPRWAPSGRR